MTELNGALIGCGFFAVNQMHAWQDVAGASIVAICDRDPERLKIVGDQYGIERRYSDDRAEPPSAGPDGSRTRRAGHLPEAVRQDAR
jgi:hypothetical protein